MLIKAEIFGKNLYMLIKTNIMEINDPLFHFCYQSNLMSNARAQSTALAGSSLNPILEISCGTSP